MFQIINTIRAIRTSSGANRLIYYAQKLPLVGSRIRDTAYSSLRVKRSAAVVLLILSILWGFSTRLAYVGLLLYWPVITFGGHLTTDEQYGLFLHSFWMISFIVAGISSAKVLEPKRDKYIAVKLMRMPAANYMRSLLTYHYATFFIYSLPAMLIFAPLLGASYLESILLTLLLTLWRIFAEYGHLKLFDRTGLVLIRRTGLVWIVIILGYLAAYMPLFFNEALVVGPLLLKLPVVLAILLLGLLGTVQLARHRDYRSAVDAAAKRDDPLLDIGRMMSEAQKSSVQTADGDYSLTVVHRQEQPRRREGYHDLNHIFFERHRSLIRKPVYLRAALIGGIGAVAAIVLALFGEQFQFPTPELGTIIPILALAMNLLLLGERLCKAMFYHCDLSLLRYSFYRREASLHFRIRLFRLTLLNLWIAGVLGAALTLIFGVYGASFAWPDMLLLWGSILSLTVFFSVHHLFMYYIFQPFSTELNMKNPFYFILGAAVSGMIGAAIVTRPPAGAFTLTAAIAAAAYLVLALILVPKIGHRTFRVK
ncbi:hypothetical protein [Paenibacillus methanolicus]|uniref:ABC-2 type transport system permease protein n=1 Tax=Paenibacillus methanolicus TaxID=582686 RepID=A0A5S5BR59_9BACL|nr:hypothetical protein [Paenibacillus methanolicus]TYP68652.1 hypothetical protein BCM02_11849 [Paenibacillus methanolicus]